MCGDKEIKKHCFVDIREKDKRAEFVNTVLNLEGICLRNNGERSFEKAKEKLINSSYPIIIYFDDFALDYIRNTTGAAAAVMNKSMFKAPEEAMEELKSISERQINYQEDVIIALMNYSYNYSEEQARKLVETDIFYILQQFFLKGETAVDCAIEIGYCCG